MNKYIIFAGVGFELIGLIIGSVYLGDYLEARSPTRGLWVSGLILFSLFGWMTHLIYLLKQAKGTDKAPRD